MPGDDRHLTGGENEPIAIELGFFWDEVVERAPADPLPRAAVDPSLTTTIRRLHAADNVPGADPAFAKRLMEDLMSAHAATAATRGNVFAEVLDPASAPAPGGRLVFPRRWWPVAELAAMIVVLLGLAGGIFIYDRDHPGLFGNDGNTPTAPAVAGTPEGTASPEASIPSDGVVVAASGTVQLPSFGSGATDLILRRVTFDEDATLMMPAAGMAYVFVPETGTYAFPDATAADGWRTEPSLETSTRFSSRGLHVRNAGDGPATALLVLIGADADVLQAPAGVAFEDLGGGFAVGLTDDVGRVSLDREVIDGRSETGDTVEEFGTVLIAVESGSLHLTHERGELNHRSRQPDGTLLPADQALNSPIPTGQAVTLGTGDSTLIQGEPDYSLFNDGADAATVLILTVKQGSGDEVEVDGSEAGTIEPTVAAVQVEGTPVESSPEAVTGDLGPEDCHTTPMTIESLDALLSTPVPAATAARIMDKPIYRSGEGDPADEATIASLDATLREMSACIATGDVERYLPFLSTDFIMLSFVPGGEWNTKIGDGNVPPIPVAFDVRIQADGRITATVDFRDGENPKFVTFANDGERWQIDYISE